MIIGVIGSRGTVPTSTDATVSFLIDNRFLFECPSEIVQSFQRFQDNWTSSNEQMRSEVEALGRPSFGKITHIILSHLHFDHEDSFNSNNPERFNNSFSDPYEARLQFES
ncbi:MAG: hypothetical protein ACW97P_07115 [Candidatus Hodarchaeales archaeon]